MRALGKPNKSALHESIREVTNAWIKILTVSQLKNLSNVPNVLKSYSSDILNMFIKVHVTVKYDANVHIRFRRRDNKIAYIHGIKRRSRSVLSVRNEKFSPVTVEFKAIMEHPSFNGTYT